jgi:hypothetical protein
MMMYVAVEYKFVCQCNSFYVFVGLLVIALLARLFVVLLAYCIVLLPCGCSCSCSLEFIYSLTFWISSSDFQ